MDRSRTERPPVSFAVIGDRLPNFEPQDSIEPSLRHSAAALGETVDVRWIPTPALLDDPESVLDGADAVWCAPGSPFLSMEGALEGIRVARERRIPFLGTCAGFQHGVIEVARNVAGMENAEHGEREHTADSPLLIAELLCSLVGQTMSVELIDDATRTIYGGVAVTERYYCRFGLNEQYVPRLAEAGLVVAGVDGLDRGTRIMRLVGHPFFYLTLFVPQTRSAPDQPHPLITSLLAAAGGRPPLEATRSG